MRDDYSEHFRKESIGYVIRISHLEKMIHHWQEIRDDPRRSELHELADQKLSEFTAALEKELRRAT